MNSGLVGNRMEELGSELKKVLDENMDKLYGEINQYKIGRFYWVKQYSNTGFSPAMYVGENMFLVIGFTSGRKVFEVGEEIKHNPWRPVDENTPRDRPILVRAGDNYHVVYGATFNEDMSTDMWGTGGYSFVVHPEEWKEIEGHAITQERDDSVEILSK